jgi:hypothetical protein
VSEPDAVDDDDLGDPPEAEPLPEPIPASEDWLSDEGE